MNHSHSADCDCEASGDIGFEGRELILAEEVIDGHSFRDGSFDFVGISGCRFVKCDFTGVRWATGILAAGAGNAPMTRYEGCVFDRGRFDAVVPGRARFVNCSFRDVYVTGWQCRESEFVDCVFSGLFERVVFDATPIEAPGLGRDRNDYMGNDFRDVSLDRVSFQGGVDLSAQQLPEGPEYIYLPDAAAVIEAIWAQVRTWNDVNARAIAVRSLDVWDAMVHAGQQSLFLRRDELVDDAEGCNSMADLMDEIIQNQR